jgi:hypothetical protein
LNHLLLQVVLQAVTALAVAVALEDFNLQVLLSQQGLSP